LHTPGHGYRQPPPEVHVTAQPSEPAAPPRPRAGRLATTLRAAFKLEWRGAAAAPAALAPGRNRRCTPRRTRPRSSRAGRTGGSGRKPRHGQLSRRAPPLPSPPRFARPASSRRRSRPQLGPGRRAHHLRPAGSLSPRAARSPRGGCDPRRPHQPPTRTAGVPAAAAKGNRRPRLS
jgi:hypothetical protein